MDGLFNIAFVIAAALMVGISMVFSKRRHGEIILWGALLVVLCVVLYRWYGSGHPPMLGTFEQTLSAAMTLLLTSLATGRRLAIRAPLGGMVIFVLLYGLFFDTQLRPLVISEQSLLVYIHVFFAWVAYGLYTAAFLVAVRVLASDRACSSDAGWAFGRGLVLGLSAQGASFIVGSYYSAQLHGSWWVWDTVEYLFLISWLLYGVALHGRVLMGWKDRVVARWVVAAFVATVALYWGLVYVPWATYHVFDIEVKSHIYSIW